MPPRAQTVIRAMVLATIRQEMVHLIERTLVIVEQVKSDEVNALTELEVEDIQKRADESQKALNILIEHYLSIMSDVSLS